MSSPLYERYKAKQRQYYLDHKEQRNAYSREYSKTHPPKPRPSVKKEKVPLSDEQKAKRSAYYKEWYAKNKDRRKRKPYTITEAAKERRKARRREKYRLEHPPKPPKTLEELEKKRIEHNEHRRQWYQTVKEKYNAYQREYRKRKKEEDHVPD